MKTLDEVIFEAPYSPTPWEADALNYLMEYRTRHEEILKTEEALGYCEMAENRPLAWQELKQMEGKPIWLEQYDPIDEKTGWHTASWYLLEFINDEYFDVRNSDGEQYCFYKDERWQAYMKERK